MIHISGTLVSIDPLFQSPSELFYGVPQRSVLGSILFLIYIIDLILAVKNTRPLACCKLYHRDAQSCSNTTSNEDFFVAFADDTTLGTLGKTEFDIKSNLVVLFVRVFS